VFIRDLLPEAPKSRERGIVNQENSRSSGIHWVAYNKYKNSIHYFDSFGNFQLPREVVKYLGHRIQNNYCRVQDFGYTQLWTPVPRFSTFFRRRSGVKPGIFKWLIYIWGVENQCIFFLFIYSLQLYTK